MINPSRVMETQFRTEDQRRAALTQSEREQILGIDPSFQGITKPTYFDNYNLPCPIRVEVETSENKSRVVVLRKTRHGNVEVEVKMFRALKEYGLPVPEILSDPFRNEVGDYVAIYSLLEGEDLQKLSMYSEDDLQEAKRLLVEAVLALMDASSFIAKHEVSKSLPQRSLQVELEAIRTSRSLWSKDPIFQLALQRIEGNLPGVTTPLVFSNGDYQPGNFLAQNGHITGFLDFESPAFQDPLMGFVKYPIYDLHPLSKTNVVETFLDAMNFTKRDFSIRLALGCLKTLQREIPLDGGEVDTRGYRERVLTLLASALAELV
jgi:hypothetical protein